MSVLSGGQAARYVQGCIGPEQQQMCGIELTLRRAERFSSAGKVAYSNQERTLAQTEELPFDGDGWVHLGPGSYLITFNEVVCLPGDLCALARPRSSLLRCGATIETALWDPGYRGRSQSLLVVHNPCGLDLRRDARLMQLLFLRLDRPAEKSYEGIYQGENI
ncbi:MAG TPA: deoxyuridine 5'-triphosphate nucleotidohydrolase [Methanotrichaceae archaeon]|nr:deoxyuridine 5'-triphosphate nucleotidohydrolase [Methanotrichaceae archaeon]HQF16677.1 deoxyuridine 5'-triphosphate nucleotidohydrolase [Methanotrichaceae archaeon]HQI91311.1 deoxyuridine 5'-triphosphate nucleotidohydrolase [Methanotrichaceae archaeon]HQJ28725.1 deoxyuridine 5'-triphosphate nucleotidohydrolase [Methanotrichaceae archaeon]